MSSSGVGVLAAIDARTRQAFAPGPSGDVTGATDTAAIVAVLAGMGKGSGLNRPTADPLVCELGAGPYYINPGQITVSAGQALRSKAPLGTQIICVGGAAGQAFITTMDPNFSTVGLQTSRGGQVAGLLLEGSLAGRGTVGVRRGDLLNSRLDVSVMNFGANLGATGVTAAITVNGRADNGTLTLASPYVGDVSVVIADLGTAVTGAAVPAGAVVAGVVKGVALYLGTQAPAPAPATATNTGTLQVGWLRNDAAITVTNGQNFIPDANAAAGDYGAQLFGTGVPQGAVVMAVDPGVGLYMGLPATGVLYLNNNGWFERADDRVETSNCACHVAYDGSATFKSDDYNKLYLTSDVDHGQNWIVQRNGSALFGIDLTAFAGFTARGGTAINNGTALTQSGTSRITGQVKIHTESAVSGVTQAVPHFQADAGSSLQGYGAMWFVAAGGATAWQNSKRLVADLTAQGISSVNFHGMVGGVWGATAAIGYGGGTFKHAGPTTKALGSAPVGANSVTVNWETGDLFRPAVLTAATAYAVAMDTAPSVGSAQGIELLIIFRQPAGGGATVTWAGWQGTITWKGGVAAQLDGAANAHTKVHLVSADGGATWDGSII